MQVSVLPNRLTQVGERRTASRCSESRKEVFCSLSRPPSIFGRDPIAIKAVVGMCRILVVDDHEPVRRKIQTLLGSRKGWFVCGEAADGLQAVKEAKSLRPDLIIMDVSMPKMNGLEASRIILREVRESRIRIISQNDPAIVRRQAARSAPTGLSRNRPFTAILLQPLNVYFPAMANRKAKRQVKAPPSSDSAVSGIAEFDSILRGGFPRNRMCLLQGPPGSGKRP